MSLHTGIWFASFCMCCPHNHLALEPGTLLQQLLWKRRAFVLLLRPGRYCFVVHIPHWTRPGGEASMCASSKRRVATPAERVAGGLKLSESVRHVTQYIRLAESIFAKM
jgi:hypothetical protein